MRASPAVLVLVLALCPATAAFADEDLAARIGVNREAIKSFAGALQKQLKSAMADGARPPRSMRNDCLAGCRSTVPEIRVFGPPFGILLQPEMIERLGVET